MKNKETYTIQDADPRYLTITYRTTGRDRKYRVNLRAGQVFTVVPDDKRALPVCMLKMTMQRHIKNELVGASTAKTSKAAATPAAETQAAPEGKL